MKKYKKNPSKIFQIRLSNEEYDQVKDFINRFGVTHREWILTVCNELSNATLIKDNQFWESWKSYAYSNNDKWDKKITDDSVCEICGVDKKNCYQLERHHYLGYEGDNAFKVKILCRSCHVKEETKRRRLLNNKKEEGVKETLTRRCLNSGRPIGNHSAT